MVTITSQVVSHRVVATQVVVGVMLVVVVAMVVVGVPIRLGGRADMSTVVVVTVVGTMVIRFQWVGATRASPIRTSPSLAIASTGDQHRWF